jgi:hypothetical protein
MKKILFLFTFGLLVSTCQAQGFGADLLLGANFSQVDGDQLGGYNKLGANIGIQISRKINETWEGAFELRYSMKGAKRVQDPENPMPDLKLSYDYLELPLLVKYTAYEKITPYVGLSIGANVINERDDNGVRGEETNLGFVEYAFHLGGTYHINDRWGADLRHSYSLLSIRNTPNLASSIQNFGRNGWYNRLFTVGITYNLDR